MKILGIDVIEPIPKQITIYECPYCTKKFTNKHSYYNHISKKWCYNYDINFYRKKAEYEANKITEEEYYLWLFENDCLDYLGFDYEKLEQLKNKLSKQLFEKIERLYNE